jgi:hypothetical protein
MEEAFVDVNQGLNCQFTWGQFIAHLLIHACVLTLQALIYPVYNWICKSGTFWLYVLRSTHTTLVINYLY